MTISRAPDKTLKHFASLLTTSSFMVKYEKQIEEPTQMAKIAVPSRFKMFENTEKALYFSILLMTDGIVIWRSENQIILMLF